MNIKKSKYMKEYNKSHCLKLKLEGYYLSEEYRKNKRVNNLKFYYKNKEKRNGICRNYEKLPEVKIRRTQQKKEYYKLNKDKVSSRLEARDKIPLNKNCDICHSTNKLQRHHWRYDKPLLVNTLCKDCHNIQHIKGFNGGIRL